jgi:hypothetical protein
VFAGSSKIDLTSHFRTFESEKWSWFAVLPLQAEGHGCEFAVRTFDSTWKEALRSRNSEVRRPWRPISAVFYTIIGSANATDGGSLNMIGPAALMFAARRWRKNRGRLSATFREMTGNDDGDDRPLILIYTYCYHSTILFTPNSFIHVP